MHKKLSVKGDKKNISMGINYNAQYTSTAVMNPIIFLILPLENRIEDIMVFMKISTTITSILLFKSLGKG